MKALHHPRGSRQTPWTPFIIAEMNLEILEFTSDVSYSRKQYGNQFVSPSRGLVMANFCLMDLWDQTRPVPDCNTAFGNCALVLKCWPISAYQVTWH